MNKYTIIIALLLIGVLVGGIIYNKRRDLPFQEIVALDKGIAVVNGQKWFMKDLKVICRENSRDVGEKHYSDKGVVIFSGLKNNHPYTIEIFRTDVRGKLLYKPLKTNITPHTGGDKYYVLIGASIGKDWKIDQLPKRLNLDDHIVFGNRTVYQFDKSKIVRDILDLPFPVSGVILKECSAYFPRDSEKSLKNLMKWVESLKQRDIKPILATTVPVTANRARQVPEKQKSLEQYNDLIRQYGQKQNCPILDLEKALRVSGSDRYLKDDLAQKDGTHLVSKAYRDILDPLLPYVLEKLGS